MILIALGTNLPGDFPTPRALAEAAAAEVAALDLFEGAPVRRSGWYRTAPVPPSGQPDYVNGVLAAEMAPPVDPGFPAALLAALQAIEARFGRVRSVPNAARTLDLDIVAIGDLVRTAPDPVLPHPRMHLRRFVLAPLGEVAPGFRHPVSGLRVDAMLAALPPDGATRLASGAPG